MQTVRRISASSPTAAPAGSNRVLAGAAEIDITPHIDLPTAGYSTEAKTALGVSGRLFARAFCFEGADGERVAICVADLMSGTRYLLEKMASITANAGITTDRLVLIGTHTHTAPAWIYGNTLYDTFASNTPGFDAGLADWLAGRMAHAVVKAADRMEPARIGFAEESVWDVSRNRSIEAFRRDPESAGWNDPGEPGADAPRLKDEQKSVDPRLRVLSAYRASDDSAIGAIAFFGAHFTSVGSGADYFSADCAGYAVRKGRFDVERVGGGKDVVVALAPTAAGDVTTLRYNLDPEMSAGPGLARWVGVRLGRAIGRCIDKAVTSADTVPIRVRYAEPAYTEPTPDGGTPETTLASRWAFGVPTLGGSEESPTILRKLGLAHEGFEGDTFSRDDPQHPKVLGLGFVQDLLRKLLTLSPASVMPLHSVAIGDLVIAGVPGEPTTLAARKIEKAVLFGSGAKSAVVVGYTGDYAGYYTTTKQYEAQHYEGSSTLYGKFATNYLAAWHGHLAGAAELAPMAGGPITFETGPEQDVFRASSKAERVDDPRPRISLNGARVELTWRMRRGSRIVFADEVAGELPEGWFVRIEQREGDGWEPATFMKRDYDDVWHVFHVRRVPSSLDFNPFVPEERWSATVFLPDSIRDSGTRLRMAVGPRDEFEGFEIEVPGTGVGTA